MANESEDELIETLWLRVEPGIKKLMPKATQIDLFSTKVMVKRALKHVVVRRESSSLDVVDKYIAAGIIPYSRDSLGGEYESRHLCQGIILTVRTPTCLYLLS